MPGDLFQIAQEHHRSGRLREAQGAYRRLMEEEPGRAEGPHWLGVLLLQANQAEEAVPLLEKAAALKPDDAAFAFNLGQVYLKLRRLDEAVAAFEKSSELDDKQSGTWLALGTALLGRNHPDDPPAALAALWKAQAAGLDSAELHRQLATALLANDKLDEAVKECRTALERDPHDAAAYYRLAITLRRLGDDKGTRKNLLKCLEIEPKFAHAWYALGMLDFALGEGPSAVPLFRRAIAAQADFTPAYEGLALALRWLGREAEAEEAERHGERAANLKMKSRGPTSVEELEKKITPDKSSLELHYALAALTNVVPPAQVPQAAVAGLFDKYADTFDEHLTGTLQYQAPQLIDRALPGELGDVLDLGCGTGLCAPLLRGRARSLVGVDLSAGMIARANERKLYDDLHVADLVEFLRAQDEDFDTLVAADVLLYIGDLSLTFEAAAKALRPGGRFAFTTEAGGGERYDLQIKTRRYRHSKPYLQKLAAMYGFSELSFEMCSLRAEALKPVAGWIVALRR